ncbi:MAG: HPF/RaiA family ribosome-associated protein [Bacteroidetes bacterium]|nr:HPF/RaiA family ribosome-associated protein [Bacteroidota bacterium]
MKIQVTFRHFNGNHPQLHQAAEELAASFTKYNSAIISTNIDFVNGSEKIVNFTVYIKDHTISSGYASDDLHKSLNAAADKVIKQLKKYKNKKFDAKSKLKGKETIQNFNEENTAEDEEIYYDE